MGGTIHSKGHVGGSMRSCLGANLEQLARENVSVVCIRISNKETITTWDVEEPKRCPA